MTEFEYTVRDPLGIHARPAGIFVNEAKKFNSRITVSANGKRADGKRIFAVMGLAVKCGDRLSVVCEGEDEAAAADAILKLLEKQL